MPTASGLKYIQHPALVQMQLLRNSIKLLPIMGYLKWFSDNGSGFASEEFADFMARNGILHVKTTPRHPSSHALVEKSVRIFKLGMKKLERLGGMVHPRLSRFLLAYRSMPQTTTRVTPAELLLNHSL